MWSVCRIDFLKCICLLDGRHISYFYLRELTENTHFETLFPTGVYSALPLQDILQSFYVRDWIQFVQDRHGSYIEIDRNERNTILRSISSYSLARLVPIVASTFVRCLREHDALDVSLDLRAEAVAHLDSIKTFVDQAQMENDEPMLCIDFLKVSGMWKLDLGLYGSACDDLRDAYGIANRNLDSKCEAMLRLQKCLASTWIALDEFEKGKSLLQQILFVCEETDQNLGKEFTIQVQREISTCYIGQGRYHQAIDLCEEVVEMSRVTFGEEDIRFSVSSTDLAIAYRSHGLSQDARRLSRKILSKLRTQLHEHDPELARLHHNMGLLHLGCGSASRAETYLRRALYSRQEILGPEHPMTADSCAALIKCLISQNKLESVEQFASEVLESLESVLGYGHSITLRARENMGLLRAVQGQPFESQEHFLEILALRMSRSDFRHPDALQAIAEIGWCLRQQGILSQAELLCRDAMQHDDILLPQSLSTVDSRCQRKRKWV